MEPLILANLTPHELKRFHAAKITYSGQAGNCCGPHSPYIATSIHELQSSLEALGWHRVSLEKQGDTWIAARRIGTLIVIDL